MKITVTQADYDNAVRERDNEVNTACKCPVAQAYIRQFGTRGVVVLARCATINDDKQWNHPVELQAIVHRWDRDDPNLRDDIGDGLDFEITQIFWDHKFDV